MAGDWEGALRLLEAMATAGGDAAPDASSCNMAARACGRAGAWQAARELLNRSEADFGVAPTERMRRSTLQACGKAGRGQAALEALLEILGEIRAAGGATPSVYGAAMDALAAMGRWEECLQLMQTMSEAAVSPDVRAYDSALHACQAAGEWQAVYDLLYRMRADEVTTSDTRMGFHVSLWKRAKMELGLATPKGSKQDRPRARGNKMGRR